MTKFAPICPCIALLMAVQPVFAKRTIGIGGNDDHAKITRDVAQMVSNRKAQSLAQKSGLNFVNVMWEDTGRFQGSSVGPNISDVTIEVEADGSRGKERHLMPVLRYPNFTDKTGDVSLEKFFIRVGNEKSKRKSKVISLGEFLRAPTRYMSLPNKGVVKGGSLLAKRDKHVLMSAQHAFLPVPASGKATFYPVIFNYQSYAKNPAVLTILVTRQGTSMTIVDNSRDSVNGSWGQRLYFNKDGKRAPLIAERLKDVKKKGVTANGESSDSLGDDANVLMLIQVPLKIKRQLRNQYFGDPLGLTDDMAMESAGAPPMAPKKSERRRSAGLDVAVLGHGPTVGPYTELDGLSIERDDRFPIRATVQFYQATDTAEVGSEEMAAMTEQIERMYAHADLVGSLVVPKRGVKRSTDWNGATAAPYPMSWHWFPGLVERYQKQGHWYHW